jgi:predicted membrane protein
VTKKKASSNKNQTWESIMDANECKQERFSSRTIGIVFLVVSILLFVIGLVVLPVVGFIFAIPLVLIGVVMLMAPESKACQLIRQGLRVR